MLYLLLGYCQLIFKTGECELSFFDTFGSCLFRNPVGDVVALMEDPVKRVIRLLFMFIGPMSRKRIK